VTTATPSLRRRVTLSVLAVFALLLVVVAIVVDVALGAQLRRDLDARLSDRSARAVILAEAGASASELVAELQGQDIRVRVRTPDGVTYGDRGLGPSVGPKPLPPGRHLHGPAPRPPAPTSTVMHRTLPDGSRLTLVADTTAITEVHRQLRWVLLGAGLAAVLLAAALLVATIGRALGPLDRLTALARRITAGDRGQRLRPDRAGTELGRAADAFDRMLDALEAAETRAQSAATRAQRAEADTRQFLADAAHELRTPLAGIHATAEQLATAPDTNAEPRQQRRAALLMRETARASRLVTDMLDMARIDAGLELRIEPTNLGTLIDGEIDRTRLLAPQLSVQRTGLPQLVAPVDPTRICQILSNLLDNARRHTPAGGHITIDLAQVLDRAEITVTDSGPGIPSTDRDRIFDRLVRLTQARDRDTGGAGLGLSIARGLARAHHGELTCLPHPHGARFQLTLSHCEPSPGCS
jgi:two-component system, OmpR family, sensor kinase